jgi:hypothetical protein
VTDFTNKDEFRLKVVDYDIMSVISKVIDSQIVVDFNPFEYDDKLFPTMLNIFDSIKKGLRINP